MLFLMTVYDNLKKPKNANAEELLKKIAKGDKNAFRQFYEATKADVYSFALSLLKNTHDAEDVMQTVYINVYQSASVYKPQGKPMAWVHTITKNLCYERFRSLSKQEEFTDLEESKISLSNNMNVEDKLLAEYCLNFLSSDERNIVVLHAVSGFKHREIARLLGLPVGTVLSKYQRAIAKIKKYLQGGEYGDE